MPISAIYILRKVRRQALQQIKSGAYHGLDRGGYLSGNRPLQQYLGFTAVLLYCLSIRLTAWRQNSKKRAERSERLTYEQSHRDYLRSGYLIIVRLSWAVNHYRDNAITYKKPSATKCQRTEAGERGNYWHADASAWCCCARCKIHEGVSWC